MSVRELPELMLTVGETADRLRISTSYAKKLIAAGTIASVKVGRCRRVRLTDLDAYVGDLEPDIPAPSGIGDGRAASVRPSGGAMPMTATRG